MRDEGHAPNPNRYVPGDENQNIPASHNAALPFTRGILGAADYTPVAFTMPGGTTAAHQLAFALLLDSPLLTIAENPFVLSGRQALPPCPRHHPPSADGMGRNSRITAKRDRTAGRHRPPQGRHMVHRRCEHRSRRGDDSRRIHPRDGPKGADRPRRGGRFAANGRSLTAGAGTTRHAVAGECGIYRRARIIFREPGIFIFL